MAQNIILCIWYPVFNCSSVVKEVFMMASFLSTRLKKFRKRRRRTLKDSFQNDIELASRKNGSLILCDNGNLFACVIIQIYVFHYSIRF